MLKESFTATEPLHKGWSEDKKYICTDNAGKRFLMRVSPKEKAEKRKHCFEMCRILYAKGVPMNEPLEIFEDETSVTLIQGWVEGQDAIEVIPTLSPEKQYAMGRKAGEILQIIHSVPAPETREQWEDFFNKKIDRKLKMAEECPIKVEHGELFLGYIESHRHLLTNRPQVFQHGDYHIGNFVVNGDALYVIDFDREDFGDPWEEFNRIVWCVQNGTDLFASGLIDGYFDGTVPETFWQLLLLYISCNTFSSLPWAIPFGETEIAVMQEQAALVLSWYNNLTRTVPIWYKKP